MTIKDIARLSGVSVSTVSRVLNNHSDVSDASREIVLKVIKDNNYIPSNTARDLVRTESDTIGFIIRANSNPFFTKIIYSVQKEIRRRGYTAVVRRIDERDNEVKAAAIMEREKRLNGIVFLGGSFEYSPKDTALINVPYVCCTYSNQYGTLCSNDYSSVSIHDIDTAYEAVKYLIDKGHREIAIFLPSTDDKSVSQLRYQGYVKALEEAGIEVDPLKVICTGSYDVTKAYEAIKHQIADKPDYTAVLCISDMIGIAAIRAFKENGIEVPDDCSIISIDGLEISEFMDPPLTTFRQPMEELGTQSAKLLIDKIEGFSDNKQKWLKTILIKGGSVKELI